MKNSSLSIMGAESTKTPFVTRQEPDTTLPYQAAIESLKRKIVSRVGADLVEAFEEMAAHLRGVIEVESYEVPADTLTPARIKGVRRKDTGTRRRD
jgi:hypothetical protein